MVPFTIYADFESLLIPHSTCLPNMMTSSTTTLQTHQPCSYGYYIKCMYDNNLNVFKSYRGEAPAKYFVESICNDAERLFKEHISNCRAMEPLTVLQEQEYITHTICHICKKEISESEGKVRDHCHWTGKYRGPAHSDCNLAFRVPNFIPVFFHNLAGYDAHLFFRELGADKKTISAIAKNKENYISYSKTIEFDNADGKKQFGKLRFIDSFKFMASSLDSLAQGLSPDDFKELKSEFQDYELLLQKGVYPYEYFDSFERFQETSLPPINAFFSKMTNCSITKTQYDHAQKVWQKYNIQNLGQYSDLYLKTDVMLLTDIFENFRKECFATYGLDPAQYFTAPSLSWDAMLKYTGVELDLLTEIDMIHFLRKGIRGGITQCSHRISNANNPFMPNYDQEKEKLYNIYLDANNLYGFAMSGHLPYDQFSWVENLLGFDVMSIDETSDKGYILEVDLTYPSTIHDLHNDLPFCAENLCPPNSKIPKLIPNLNNKEKYVVDYRVLKQALNNGLVLTKIHRILEFRQKPWLKPYIELNNNLRTAADTEFKKNFYKYMNNSVFGKTMENVEKRVDIKIATRWERRGKSLGVRDLIAKPNFNSISILTEEMAVVQMNKTRILYNKPIYVGFVVLELSKKHMYSFHYDNMLKDFNPNRIRLCYSDTDSFIYQSKSNIYEYIKNKPELFDTSNYSPTNDFGIKPQNKKVLGLFKDENGGQIMTNFVGLRAKMYAFKVQDGCETKKAKGVKKSALQELGVEDYEKVCMERIEYHSKMCVFRSKLHQVYTELLIKKSLSGNDDKRYILEDGQTTLALGHYKIKEIEDKELEILEDEVFTYYGM
jgi:hypothetical protein